MSRKTSKSVIMIVIILVITSFIGKSQQTVFINADSLNFRTDSSFTDNIIMKLQQGTEVILITKSANWAKINYNGTIGYVATKYISTTKPIVRSRSEAQVYICNSKASYAYHSHYCSGLKRCKSGVSQIGVSEAKKKGYSACKICY